MLYNYFLHLRGHTLQFVPETLKTVELCLEAVKQNHWVIEYVPVALRMRLNKERFNFFYLPYMPEFLANIQWLKQNDYPGRGIVMGLGAGGERVQIYWIMGRSENSKNRIFVQNEDGSVSTKAFDEKKLTDPSLIIYNPFKVAKEAHIISNGDQTDTISEFLNAGKTFEDALKTRTYEPDAPNYTPRISGIFYPNGSYALSILKASDKQNPKRESIIIEKETGTPNTGEMLTTYECDGDPLQSFTGLPRLMPIKNTAQENLDFYWEMLNPKYRVSILINWQNSILIRNTNV